MLAAYEKSYGPGYPKVVRIREVVHCHRPDRFLQLVAADFNHSQRFKRQDWRRGKFQRYCWLNSLCRPHFTGMGSHHLEDLSGTLALHSHIVGECKVQIFFREDDSVRIYKAGCGCNVSPVEAIATGPPYASITKHVVIDSIDQADLIAQAR